VFASLEVALCLITRQLPQITPKKMGTNGVDGQGDWPPTPLHFRKYSRLSQESSELVQLALRLLVKVHGLCSPKGSLVVLPTTLYLVMAVLREAARLDDPVADQGFVTAENQPGHVSSGAMAAILTLRGICSSEIRGG